MKNLLFNKNLTIAVCMVFAMMFVFSSCGKEDVTDVNNVEAQEQSFDYSLYDDLASNSDYQEISNQINSSGINDRGLNHIQRSNEMLSIVNSYFDTDISIPNSLVETMSYSPDEIPNKLHSEMGLLSNLDMQLIDEFVTDLQSSDFNTALKNHEASILNLKLSANEFAKKNLFVNMLKSMNHYHPEVYSAKDQAGKIMWPSFECAAATIFLGLATTSLSSCVAGGPVNPACYGALISYVGALSAYHAAC